MLLNNALLIIMFLAAVYIAFSEPNFVSPSSLINLLSQTAAYLPVALGIGGCIILTGTDLSAGRTVGITACVSASLLQAVSVANKMWPGLQPLPVFVVILISVGLGALIGAFNGFWVAKFKLHPFIVTLATQLILYTVLLLYVQMGNNSRQCYFRPGCVLYKLRKGFHSVGSCRKRCRGADPQLCVVRYHSDPCSCGLSGIKPHLVKTCLRWAPMKKRPAYPV